MTLDVVAGMICVASSVGMFCLAIDDIVSAWQDRKWLKRHSVAPNPKPNLSVNRYAHLSNDELVEAIAEHRGIILAVDEHGEILEG